MQTLKGHTSCVNCLVYIDDNRLVSGSSDNTIKIWDMPTTAVPVAEAMSSEGGGAAAATPVATAVTAVSCCTVPSNPNANGNPSSSSSSSDDKS